MPRRCSVFFWGLFAVLLCYCVSLTGEVHGLPLMPQLMGGGGSEVSWAAWDESSQTSLANDDIFVCFFDAGGIGDDDIGVGGGLSGASLVVTESGNVPAASAGYRQLTTASNQYFTWTQAAIESLIKNQAEWTIVLKIKDWSTVASASDVLILFSEVVLTSDNAAGGKLRFLIGTSDVNSTDVIANNATLYFAIWRKNGAVKAAWHTSRPTAESHFTAGKTCESTDDSTVTSITAAYIGADAAHWSTIKLAWLVVAKKALFN